MFLFQFPKYPGSKIRIGTVVMRFESCSTFTSLRHLMILLGVKKASDALQWVWTDDIYRDVHQIFLYPDEISLAHSYFPYFVPMGLSAKSPYSAASNQSLHMFIHGIGSLVNSPRSLNAAAQLEINTISLAKNIAGAFLGAKISGGLVRHLVQRDEYIRRGGDAPAAGGNAAEDHPSIAIYEELEVQDFRFNLDQQAQLVGAVRAITNPRVGSVGHWMSLNFLNCLTFYDEEE